MHLRVSKQSASGTEIVQWLSKAVVPEGQEFDGIPGGVIAKVRHSSLQETDANGFNPSVQMEGGFNAYFSILVRKYTRTMHNSVLTRMKAFKRRVRGEASTLTGPFSCGETLPLGSECVDD
jgi:hypothetical protein